MNTFSTNKLAPFTVVHYTHGYCALLCGSLLPYYFEIDYSDCLLSTMLKQTILVSITAILETQEFKKYIYQAIAFKVRADQESFNGG